jgi:DNA polymerase-3 subunit beta
MHFSVPRDSFLKSLLLVQGAIDKRQTMPILSNILIRKTPAGVTLLATDLDIELVVPIEATWEAPEGSMTVPARKCLDITRALPEGALLKLSQTDQKVLITSGRSRFSLASLPPEQYPSFEYQPASIEISLSQGDLKRLLDQTSFAMAQQDVRYYLNGLLLAFSSGALLAVATDGHRLATQKVEGLPDLKEDLKIIVPRKAVLELSRLLQESGEEVNLKVTNQSLRVLGSNFSFSTKLIEGRYPDYQRLLLGEGTPLVIEREPFKQVLQRVAVLLNERSRGALFVFSSGLLSIRARNVERDEVEEQIEIDYEGPELEIGFNLSYLLEYLTIVKTRSVRLYLSNPKASLRMEAVVEADSSITRGQYLVMPMQL